MKILAVIPARSGSKGLRNKNIKELCGKPLMAHTIEAALRSGIFDEVMVSTDSEKYAQIARKYGAKVPFLRSKETSSDISTTKETVIEVLDRYKEINRHFDVICILQPTSPLRDKEDIQNALSVYIKNKAKAVISVCEAEHSPLWMNTIGTDSSMAGFIQNDGNRRRQDIDKFYRINGAIYMVDTVFYRNNTNIYCEGSYACVMEKSHSIDIDDIYDFAIAEFLLQKAGKVKK